MAQTPTKITTHVADGLARRLQQFKSKPNLQAYLTVYLTRAQELEDAYYQLLTDRHIDTTVGGAVLDILGAVVGIAREGLNDEQYRVMIRVQILANISSGTFEDIIDVFEQLDPGNTYTIEDSYPAGFTLTASDVFDTPIPETRIAQLLAKIRSAGVESQLVFPMTEPPATVFEFAPTSALVEDDPAGFLYGVTGLDQSAATNEQQGDDYNTFVVPVIPERTGATNGAGVWLFPVIRNSDSKIQSVIVSDDDGLTFSSVDLPSVLDSVTLVAYTSGVFFVGGSDATSFLLFRSSNDGASWTPSTVALTDYPTAVTDNGANTIVLGDNDGVVWRSIDTGLTFTGEHTLAAAPVRGVLWNDALSLFVAFGNGAANALATSPDGDVWTNRTIAAGPERVEQNPTSGYMVAYIIDGTTYHSLDGVTWVVQAAPGNDFVASSFAQGLFWLFEEAPELWSSPDGITWTSRSIPDDSEGELFLINDGLEETFVRFRDNDGNSPAWWHTTLNNGVTVFTEFDPWVNLKTRGGVVHGKRLLILVQSTDTSESFVIVYEHGGGQFVSAIVA